MSNEALLREKIARIVCWHKPDWMLYQDFITEDRDFGLKKADQILQTLKEAGYLRVEPAPALPE